MKLMKEIAEDAEFELIEWLPDQMRRIVKEMTENKARLGLGNAKSNRDFEKK